MANFIVKFGGKYLEWSTIVDAPATNLMTEEELRHYIKSEYGDSGLEKLPARMERVEKTGTSALSGLTSRDLLGYNRAGPRETHIAAEAEMIAAYTERHATQPDEPKK